MLWSGLAPVADKKFLLAAFAVAAFATGLSSSAQAANGPPPKTAQALGCMVGLEAPGCETVFENPGSHAYSYCAEEFVWRRMDDCPNGPLERIVYLGTNAAANDVYQVNWMNLHSIFILPPPGPDGKVGHSPWRRTSADLTVTSPVNRTLYIRPKENGSVE